MVDRLEAGVLGAVEVRTGTGPVRLGGPIARGLVAQLLLDGGRTVSRDRLIDGLWGEEPPVDARASIQSHVSRLRRAFDAAGGPSPIRTDEHGYRFDDEGLSLDLEALQGLAERGRAALGEGDADRAVAALEQAASLVQGTPLAGLDLPFVTVERARMLELGAVVVDDLHEARLQRGDDPALVADLRRVIEGHPHRERPRLQVMRALYAVGRHTDALAEARAYAQVLADDLGVDVGPAVLRLEHDVLNHTVPATATATETATAAAAPTQAATADPAAAVTTSERQGEQPQGDTRTRPTRRLDSFVGREEELGRVRALLERSGARLVTLTGPGGAGKTRLAEEVSADWHGDAVDVVHLDELAEESLFLDHLGRTVGVVGPVTTAAVADALGGEDHLLVVDNVEHVLGVMADVEDLLAQRPGLRVLVTSRVATRVSGEHEVVVPPLSLTPPTAEAPSEAAALLLARARSRSGRALDRPADLDAAERVSTLVDGLPLAIELAAARSKLLSLGGLAERLESSSALLADTAGRRPQRHRTVGSTIEWSVHLLPASGRELLARLSVLPGTFDLTTAVAVGPDAEHEVLDGLELLVDHSLLRRASDGDGLSMLRMVRAHAAALLDALGARGDAERRRDAHVTERAARHARDNHWLPDGETLRWSRRNAPLMRAVLRSLDDRGDDVTLITLVGSLLATWSFDADPSLHVWIGRAVERADAAPPAARALLLAGAAQDASFARSAEATVLAAAALAVDGQGRAVPASVVARCVLGQDAAWHGDRQRADAFFATAAADARAAGAIALAGMVDNYVGDAHLHRGETDAVAAVSHRVISSLGHRDRAGALHVPIARSNLAMAHLLDGDVDVAEAPLLHLLTEVPLAHTRAIAMTGLARVAVARGQHQRAADLLAASEAYARRHRVEHGPPEQRVHDQTAALLAIAAPDVRASTRPDTGSAAHVAELVAELGAGAEDLDA